MEIYNFMKLDRYLLSKNGKIIHQVWFNTIQSKKKTKESYDKLSMYRNSWKKRNPTWFHFEWNAVLAENLIKNIYPEHYSMYKQYDYEIQKCDAVRYFFLHRYGGLYVDMDYYCNKSFDEVFLKYKKPFYLVQSPNNGGGYFSNSLMFSKPKHQFWKYMFIDMEVNKTYPVYYSRHLIVMYTTGPGILSRVYNKHKYKLKLSYFPAKLFHPYGITDNILSLNKSNAYAIHIGKGSWEKKDSKFLIYVYKEYKILLFIVIVLFLPYIIANYLQKTNNERIDNNTSVKNIET